MARAGASAGRCHAKQRLESGCLLASLADVRLIDVLPGLIIEEKGLRLDDLAFSCCDGTGRRLDSAANTTLACDLQARLESLRKLFRQFERTLGLDRRSMATAISAASWDALRPAVLQMLALRRGETRQGLIIRSPANGAGLSVWTLAAAAIWRFGFGVHVVVLGRTPNEQLVQKVSDRVQGSMPRLILVENASKLWDSRIADQLEYIVTCAYNAMTPLFIKLDCLTAVDSKPAPIVSQSLKATFKQRLDQIKSQTPLTWLRPDCVSKLSAICAGAEALHVSAVPERASGMPKLPWDP